MASVDWFRWGMTVMTNGSAFERLAKHRGDYPKFFAWVSSNPQVVVDFDCGRWESPAWENRVTPQALAQIFGRPMPEEYFRFLRAYCYAEARKNLLGLSAEGGLHVDPVEAFRLAEGEEAGAISILRYDVQPEEFYPFAQMGVDGVSYNFYFDGDGFVVVYFSPMDETQVPFFYPDLESFLIDEILAALDRMEPDEALRRELDRMGIGTNFREGTCLDCITFIEAFGLDLPTIKREQFGELCKERVRSMVRSGKFSHLKRWI